MKIKNSFRYQLLIDFIVYYKNICCLSKKFHYALVSYFHLRREEIQLSAVFGATGKWMMVDVVDFFALSVPFVTNNLPLKYHFRF